MPGSPLPRGRLTPRLTVLLLALPLAGTAALSDTRVLLDHGRVSIHSESAPLSDVLSRFAQATGAEVVYEATRPRQLVSVVIEAASAAEAIARLLEGQGLNYTLRLDPTGRNVEMLVVSGSTSAAAAPAGAARAPRPAAPPPPEEAFELLPEEDEEPPVPAAFEAPEPGSPAGHSAEEGVSPGFAPPFAGTAPGTAPATEGTGQAEPSGPPTAEPGQPRPPVPASYPAGPPPSPVYPGPASYPGGE